jgi:hypothetical protein
MHIRDGLVDPKHYKAMGEAIWLYLYLHRECAAKTGLVKLYKHHEAAAALGITRRGVMLQMDRLERAGYVTVTRGQHGLSVQISRYAWQARRSGPSPDVQSSSHQSPSDVQSSSHEDMPQMCSPVPPDVNSRSPILLNTSSFNGVNDSIGAAPVPPTPEPPPSLGADAPVATAQNETTDTTEAKAVAAEKRRQDLAEARLAKRAEWVQTFCRRAVKSLGWEKAQATTREGWAVTVERQLADCSQDERDRFGHWLFSDGWYQGGRGFTLGSALSKAIDTWKSAGKPHDKAAGRQEKSAPPRFVPSMIQERPLTKEAQEWEALIKARDAKRAAEAQATGGVP